MILGTAQAIKIIIFAITVLIGENYRKKFFPKSSRFVLTVGIVLCASIAVYCANRVPPLTDEVTLTALGEHNPEAKKEEIYLNGYTVDGKNYSSGESLQIMDGKWFWNGETYCWRIGTDTRQPKGTTRSIVIRIPVGWERTFNFAGGVWRGKVQVNIDGRQWDVDTYTESPLTVPVQIGRSSTKILIFNQVIRLAVYAMILGALTAILIFLIQIIKKDPVRSHIWLEHHITKIIYGFLALVAFILLFRHADEISLWNDEVAQIQFSIQGIAESLKLCLQMVDITPPLFTICAAIWYGIAPYGEQWLLLPSILFTVLSIYYIGLVGECLGGKYCGILSAVLMAFSTTVWQYIAYEFRAYSFVLLFSTLALYFFILCNQNVEQMKWRIFYSITLTMLAMSHYFGMLACGLFFFADIYLFYKKQIDWKKLGIYILLGAVSLIWLTMVFWTTLRYKRPEQIATWYPVPGISQIQSMIYYLTGNFDLTYWAFLVGIIAAFSFFLRTCSHKSIHSKSKIDKSQKDDIKFVIAGKNTAKTLDATKKSLNLITLFVQFLIVVPRLFTIALWRNNRHIAKLHSQSSRLVPLISPVHQEVNRMVHRTELLQKGTTFWTVATVSRRQRKDYPIPIRCGNHMKFGVPSAPCPSDGLRPVFFKAPIPSG